LNILVVHRECPVLHATLREQLVQSRINPAGIALEDLVAILLAQALHLVDVAPGVVVMMPGLGSMPFTAPSISEAKRMLSAGMTRVSSSMPGK